MFLNLPVVGDPGQLVVQDSVSAYRPLEGVSQLVVDAIAPSPYIAGNQLALFSLMIEVAAKLVRESKPLEGDFARVVDREFWNLLR
jgi:hypothetical protein